MRTPDLHVDELHLRLLRPGDAEAMTRACQDPEMHRWLSGLPRPYLPEHGEFFMGQAAAEAAAGTALHLGVFADGEFAGSVVLHSIDEEAGSAELGYWTAPWSRGRRVSERACRALAGWAFGEGLTRLDWHATVGNHASRLTALRIGFRMIGVRPAPDCWIAALTPADLATAHPQEPDFVRRQARVFHAEPPVLRAGPVTLRKPEECDIPGLVTAMNDPAVVNEYGVRLPYTEADARHHVREEAPGLWARGVEAAFTIVDGLDAYAGSIDVRVTDRDPAAGELGYLITPRSRGKGYAVAAVRALSGWAFEALGLSRLEIRPADGNEASLRVATRAGFTTEGLLRQALIINGKRRDVRVASLLREEVA